MYMHVEDVQEIADPNDLDGKEGFVIANASGDKILLATGSFTDRPEFELHTLKPQPPTSEAAHVDAINQAIEIMKGGDVRKIVLSRLIGEDLALPPLVLFREMCERYPDAFVQLISLPQTGCWLGASPELLIHKKGRQILTISLAGTKLPAEDWTDKEKDEQGQVTEFIKDTLSELEIDPQIGLSNTVSAGPVEHLRTNIAAETNLPAPAIAAALHPTPAVCGNPRAAAAVHIRELEGHDRRLYTGYTGFHCAERTDLYVNLRCMEIHDAGCTLYVGGGITAQSDPAAELEETARKANTLLSMLNG